MISPKARVKRQDVDAGVREHGKAGVVRVDPCVVDWMSALHRDPIGVFIVLLLRLIRPRELGNATPPAHKQEKETLKRVRKQRLRERRRNDS